MILAVEVTKSDYKKFLRYYIIHSKVLKRMGTFIFGVTVTFQLIVSKMDFKVLSIFLLGDVLLFGYIFWQIVSSNSSKVLEGDPRLGYKEIIVTPKGLELKQDGMVKGIEPNRIRNFTEDKNSFYLYSSYSNVIILPKRFFESEGEQQDFRESVKQFVMN